MVAVPSISLPLMTEGMYWMGDIAGGREAPDDIPTQATVTDIAWLGSEGAVMASINRPEVFLGVGSSG